MSNDRTIVTGRMILNWPQLFEAKAYKKQKAKFSAKFMTPKDGEHASFPDLNDWATEESLDQCLKNAIRQKWPNSVPRGLKKGKRDGDTDESFSEISIYENMLVYSATRRGDKTPPVVIGTHRDPETGKLIVIDEDPNGQIIYGGCHVRVKMRAYAFDNEDGGRGVTWELLKVQKIGDGEHFADAEEETENEDDFDSSYDSIPPKDQMMSDDDDDDDDIPF